MSNEWKFENDASGDLSKLTQVCRAVKRNPSTYGWIVRDYAMGVVKLLTEERNFTYENAVVSVCAVLECEGYTDSEYLPEKRD